MSQSPQKIGIAVVEHDGCFLVGVRPPDVDLPGRAEFPGGKCFPDEAPAACAVRECREETGLEVAVERTIDRVTFDYDHGRLELHFFECRLADRTLRGEAHRGFTWVAGAELKELDFPEANRSIVERLSR